MSSCGATGHQDGHQVLLSDLHHAEERAQDLFSHLGCDLALLLVQQQEMEVVMEKLRQVNQSLRLMLVAVEGAQKQLEKHLQSLHDVLQPAGWTPSAISTCILHCSCFLLLVVLLVPTPPPAIILFLLFLTCSTLGGLLSIPVLFTLLSLAVAGRWLLVATHRGAKGAWTVPPPQKPQHQLTSTPEREHEAELLKEELGRMEISCLQEPSCLEQPPVLAKDLPGLAGQVSPTPGGWRPKLSSCGVVLEPPMGTGKRWEPQACSPSRSLTPNRASLSPRSPCQGLTRSRQQCRKKAISGQGFCHLHATS